MTTVTVDIMDEKGLTLLKDLEALNIIRLHDNAVSRDDKMALSIRNLKGKMTKQSIEEIERQLVDFRKE